MADLTAGQDFLHFLVRFPARGSRFGPHRCHGNTSDVRLRLDQPSSAGGRRGGGGPAAALGRRWRCCSLGQSYGWVDKAQTEAFAFSLLAIALVLLRERPWWSFVCLGAASTPESTRSRPRSYWPWSPRLPSTERGSGTRAFWVGLGVAVGLALLAPIYYLVRIGEVSSQIGTAERSQIPSWAELKVPLLDLNSGLALQTRRSS